MESRRSSSSSRRTCAGDRRTSGWTPLSRVCSICGIHSARGIRGRSRSQSVMMLSRRTFPSCPPVAGLPGASPHIPTCPCAHACPCLQAPSWRSSSRARWEGARAAGYDGVVFLVLCCCAETGGVCVVFASLPLRVREVCRSRCGLPDCRHCGWRGRGRRRRRARVRLVQRLHP
jgi:hypothetical protein